MLMYIFKHKLAQGGFGTVFCAKRSTDGNEVAIKRGHGWNDKEGVDTYLLRELQILKKIASVHGVVHLMDVFHVSGDLCLVFPLATRSIYDALKQQDIKPWLWTRDLLSGLHALHEAGIVHRDISPGNLLLFEDNLKISDFGMAIDKRMINNDFDGEYITTPEFRAPELVTEAPYSSAVDVWSAGCIIWQLFTGSSKPLIAAPRWTEKDFDRPKRDRIQEHLEKMKEHVNLMSFPCKYEKELNQAMKTPTKSSKMKGLSGDVRLLLALCLMPDPMSRPTTRAILKSLSTFV
jgi:serine/threonine protein kinase